MRTRSRFIFIAATISFGCIGALASAADKLLPATTSWIGNTFGFGDGAWTQIDITAIAVAPDGKVYTDAPWDESGAEASIYQNGRMLGFASGTHGWGYGGGNAIAINRRYAFIAASVGNEKGHLVGAGRWPVAGQQWFGISRRAIGDLQPSVPFRSATLTARSPVDASFLRVNEVSAGTPADIGGLAASDTTLYAANTSRDEIDVYDAESMQLTMSWPVHEPGRIALASDGTLWVLTNTLTGAAPAVEHHSPDGHKLPDTLRLPADSVAVDIAIDASGHILIADNGPRQQVLIFSHLNAGFVQTATLGEPGGIFGGKASDSGRPGPGRFNGLTGVGTDAAGNVYVSMNGIGPRLGSTGAGLGTSLESYTPSGHLRWKVDGLLFVDGAWFDPGRPDSVFTGNKRFSLDWSKPPGHEWKYVGFLSNRFKYPQDPVFSVDQWPGMPIARKLDGHTFLYLVDMYGEHLKIYRFDAASEGETAIPSGFIAGRAQFVARIPNHPPGGDWIWRDANGNGDFEANEFERNTTGTSLVAGWGWWVDANGDIWRTNNTNIHRLRFGGIDHAGNPIYSYTKMTTFPMPAPFSELRRVIYEPKTDTLYVTGYTRDEPRTGGVSKEVGRVLVRFDAWSSGSPIERYAITLPWNTTKTTFHTLASLTVEDRFIFAVETTAATVHVYDKTTGTELGVIEPGPQVGHASGWVDVVNGISAHQRANGEYLIFVEEDARGKVLMYRWKP